MSGVGVGVGVGAGVGGAVGLGVAVGGAVARTGGLPAPATCEGSVVEEAVAPPPAMSMPTSESAADGDDREERDEDALHRCWGSWGSTLSS